MRRPAIALALVLAVAGPLLVAGPVAAAPAVHASSLENAATVRSFEADYYLDRDAEGRSTLRTVETIVMDFPAGAGEHGPLRYLVQNYEGHPTDLELESVVDESGAPWNYETEDEDGYLSLRIGDADVEVEGERTYVISYTQQNVTLFPDDADTNEFYWDVNGTQWQIPFDSVVARVHIPTELASSLTGTTACYSGPLDGQASCDAESSTEGDGEIVYEARASALAPEETLTLAIGFAAETFVPRETSPFGLTLVLEIIFTLIALVIGLVTLTRRRTVFADGRGRPTIIAEYLPPKGVSVLEAAVVMRATKKAVAAQLIDLAVRRILRIIETPEEGLFSKKPAYTLELRDPSRLAADEAGLARAFFGTSLNPGDTQKLAKSDTALSKQVYAAMQAFRASETNTANYKKVTFSARFVPLFFGVGAVALSFFMLIALLADARDFLIPLLVFVPALFAAIVIFATVFRTPLSDRGAELRDHLEGLRLYIRVAERDRIRILQSPEGAERAPVDTSDTGLMLTLYERVLPYAVLFDEEKQWAKTLGEYYDEQPPEWYSGSNAFSAGVFAAGISSVSSFTSASYSGTSSSSSSGSSGGGSSGGGGGGGGGGSW